MRLREIIVGVTDQFKAFHKRVAGRIPWRCDTLQQMNDDAPKVIARAWTDSGALVIKSLIESYQTPCYYTIRA